MPQPLTLVLLAAGMGSRYGGLKQLEQIGPGGETLMDYSVFDAVRAGFTRAVFIVRPDIEDAFRTYATGRFGNAIEITTALQRLEDVPPGFAIPEGRAKPWGTTHALLAAAAHVSGPFAVVNADDFYGRRAFTALADALSATSDGAPPEYALVGYRMRDTMSDAGTVNRGVCETDEYGWLQRITETFELAPVSSESDTFTGRDREGAPRLFDGDTLVSMNAWGFLPSVFDILRTELNAFFAAGPGARGEAYLPEAVSAAIRDGRGRVRVLDARSEWLGITYPADRQAVQSAVRRMVAAGEYPSALWSSAGN